MPFIPGPELVSFEARFSINGAATENCLGFYIGGADFATSAATICDAWEGSVWGAIRALAPPTTILREMYVVDLSAADAPTYTQLAFDETDAGTVLTDSLPNNAALVVSLRTANRGRSARGRNYIGGLAEGTVTNSVYLSTAIDPILGAYEDCRAALQALGITMVVLSKETGGAPRAAIAPYIVTEYVVTTPAVRSQRRRNLGIGS